MNVSIYYFLSSFTVSVGLRGKITFSSQYSTPFFHCISHLLLFSCLVHPAIAFLIYSRVPHDSNSFRHSGETRRDISTSPSTTVTVVSTWPSGPAEKDGQAKSRKKRGKELREGKTGKEKRPAT